MVNLCRYGIATGADILSGDGSHPTVGRAGVYEGPLRAALDFIASDEMHFDADFDIYGDFREPVSRVRKAYGAPDS